MRPAGSVSMKARPVIGVAAGLVSTKLMLTVPPRATVGAANDLAIVGGTTTVTVAVLDAAPLPVSFELIAPVVLFFTPAVAPVTVTVMVQLALAPSVPPVKVSTLLLVTRFPPHVAADALGVVSPAGSVSLKVSPVIEVAAGLVSTKLMLTVPPRATVGAANDFVIVGGATTVTVAVLDVAPAPVWLELIAPVVLFFPPSVAPVTVTVIVQLALAASVPPVKVSTLLLVSSVPPQVAVDALGVVRPDGSESVKASPVSGVAPGLVSTKLMLTFPPRGTIGAAKDFAIVGGVRSDTVLLTVDEFTPATVAKALFVTDCAATSAGVTV